MKHFLIFIIFPLLVSCSSEQTSPSTNYPTALNKQVSIDSTTKLINSFREFRNALYQGDKERVKQFFHFPIITKDDPEIWYLTGASDTHDNTKPFTEQDFDGNYSNLFPKMFINAILKVKSEELFNKDGSTTIDIKDGDDIYNMHTWYDSTSKLLSLSFNSRTAIKDSKGVIEEYGEYSICYQFDLLLGSNIRFRRIKIAG